MALLTVRIDLPPPVKGLIRHTIDLLPRHFEVHLEFVESDEMLTIGDLPSSDIRLSPRFIEAISQRQLRHQDLMFNEPLITFEDGQPDYLGTCAYMAHYLQEQVDDPQLFDELDRFRYSCSFQHRFDCVEENLVLKYFIKLRESTRLLQNLQRRKNPSRLFLSHDIDVLSHGIWPDLKTAIRKGKLKIIWNLLTKDIQGDRDLALFEKMLTINSRYGYNATFFWMVNQVGFRAPTGDTIENANYNFHSDQVQGYLQFLEGNGQEIQLHQSLGGPGLIQEAKTFGRSVLANRNHYLHGKLPDIWHNCEIAKIPIDCSAGFPEVIGFRNAYGAPIRPFNLNKDRPFDVVEAPLHIMDVVLMKSDLKPAEALDQGIHFINTHRDDCVLSLLWHNNYFSSIKYSEWLELYQGMLKQTKEVGMQSMNINRFKSWEDATTTI